MYAKREYFSLLNPSASADIFISPKQLEAFEPTHGRALADRTSRVNEQRVAVINVATAGEAVGLDLTQE